MKCLGPMIKVVDFTMPKMLEASNDRNDGLTWRCKKSIMPAKMIENIQLKMLRYQYTLILGFLTVTSHSYHS